MFNLKHILLIENNVMTNLSTIQFKINLKYTCAYEWLGKFDSITQLQPEKRLG